VEIPTYQAGVRPGDFAEVQIVTERHQGVTLAPRIAVISEKGEDVVYVAANGTAERRVVSVGFTDNDNAEILSGLKAGESVVVKGQRSLKHGSPIKILDESAPAVAEHKAS
jgi:membrane fusion protein (multidrug efflux system)